MAGENETTLSEFASNLKNGITKLEEAIITSEEDRTKLFSVATLLAEKWTLEELIEKGCPEDYAKQLKGGK